MCHLWMRVPVCTSHPHPRMHSTCSYVLYMICLEMCTGEPVCVYMLCMRVSSTFALNPSESDHVWEWPQEHMATWGYMDPHVPPRPLSQLSPSGHPPLFPASPLHVCRHPSHCPSALNTPNPPTTQPPNPGA